MDDSGLGSSALNRLDGLNSWVERPVRRIVGSDRFNPLPHAGTISVFLLGLVVATGVYITLFYQYGYEASYDSVLAMQQHPIQRVIRAMHRYSSAALVVTSVVHAWRIFIAGRFTVRRRRWRWLTGVAMLLIIWPAGVTGYLLVWDTRAQAIADAMANVLSSTGVGSAWSIRYLIGGRESGGSGFLLVVWLAHLSLTSVAGWFAYRHLRRSRLPWRPPRHWMILLGVSLFVVSIVVPVGMLAPANPGVLADRIPLDPFVLFLLPVLGTEQWWLTVVAMTLVTVVGLAVPFLINRRQPEPARILVDECTGCNLCVVDCPYDALSLVALSSVGSDHGGAVAGLERSGGVSGSDSTSMVARVDVDACVSCGICLGSCAFHAIEVPGIVAPAVAADAAVGASPVVTVACDRHLVDGGFHDDRGREIGSVVPVRCAGVVGVDLVKQLRQAGATEVNVVGCARDDCRYGVGNTLASERITGARAPHLPRAARASVSESWAGRHDLGHAEHTLSGAPAQGTGDSERSEHGLAGRDGSSILGNDNRRSLVAAGAVVAASVVAIAAATFAPFGRSAQQAAVRVVVDQEPGRPLRGTDDFDGSVEMVTVTVDGEELDSASPSSLGDSRIGVFEWLVPAGSHRVVVAVEGRAPDGDLDRSAALSAVVFDETVELLENQRLQVPVVPKPLAGNAAVGQDLFQSRVTGCSVCHSVRQGENLVGPSLYGVADRAGSTLEGIDAETYLWQSILLPDEYVVEGYPAGQMLPIYRDRLSPEELDAVIDYLLTLRSEPAPAEGGSDTVEGTDS